MSDRSLRQPLSTLKTSRTPSLNSLTSVNSQSQKRKSSDEESENVSPNVKKVKSTKDTAYDATVSEQKKKATSGLPKRTGGKISAQSIITTTPGKSIGRGASKIGTPYTSKKADPIPKIDYSEFEKIEGYFETTLTIDKAKITQIKNYTVKVHVGKAKNARGAGKQGQGPEKKPFLIKDSAKTKEKKLEEMTEALTEAANTLVTETTIVRIICVAHQAVLVGVIKTFVEEKEELKEALALCQTSLQESQTSLHDEKDKNRIMSSKYDSMKVQQSPMRNKNKEANALNAELQEKYEDLLKNIDEQKKSSDEVISQLQTEFTALELTLAGSILSKDNLLKEVNVLVK